MKSDILVPTVTDVIIAVVPRPEAAAEELWDVYIINQRGEPMDNILITSQGYGSVDGQDMATTTLRHFHQNLATGEALKIEPIQTALFGLNNEYWISFNNGEVMLDKKFIFKAGTISEDQLVEVPVIKQRGIMVR
ncbi:hypothetical protein [Lewinella sp. 4G2]|uniref:hypothetical protein n=1 Tax=Lewinella sp. 4G2 TaxID=1803372 RepID=UPI0007B4E63E|nr:hypothetical protein [Lewinella sp. 4G2]OAV46078.1 hypothetical protein A3850_017600 [Lewinella sp. 4G2]